MALIIKKNERVGVYMPWMWGMCIIHLFWMQTRKILLEGVPKKRLAHHSSIHLQGENTIACWYDVE
jgi:hypothetical protein